VKHLSFITLFSYYIGFVYSLFAWVEIVNSKNSKTGGKKGGSGIASRKALNDITNKASFHPETSILM